MPNLTTLCSGISNIDGVVGCLVGMMRAGIYLLISFALLYTIYGGVRFIKAEGNERNEWRNVMLYGIIGIAVMVSIWGIIGILTGAFGFTNEEPVPPPRITLPTE